ncbi:MAG: hypothetical protein ACRDKS_17710 [Actinomycetota bacterium]
MSVRRALGLCGVVAAAVLSLTPAGASGEDPEWVKFGWNRIEIAVCYDLSKQDGYSCPGPGGRAALDVPIIAGNP